MEKMKLKERTMSDIMYEEKCMSNIVRERGIVALQQNTAITLIALIITIIILLILAGVALNMLMGENGIINKAQLAKEKTNQVQEQEKDDIKNLESNIESYGTSRNNAGNSYDVLWNWESIDSEGNINLSVANAGSITLNKNIENYKYLIVFAKGYLLGNWGYQVSTIVPSKVTTSSVEYANSVYRWSDAGFTIAYGFLSSNTLDIGASLARYWSNCSITEVWGIK